MFQYKKSILYFSFFTSLCFYTPVFAAYFQNVHKMSNHQITLLFAIFSFATFLSEIPAGIIGDRIGEKTSLVISSIFVCLSTIFFLIGNYFLVFVGEILFAISGAFRSGAFESLIYQYCNGTKDKGNYNQLISKIYSIQWIALCFSFAGCSLLSASLSMEWAFYSTLIANVITLIFTFSLPQIERERKKKSIEILSTCLKTIKDKKEVQKVIFYNSFCTTILISGYHIFQPYLNEIKIENSYNGILYFLGAICASYGSFIFRKLSEKMTSKSMLFLCIILLEIAMFGLLKTSSYVLIIAVLIGIYRLAWGITSPLLVSMANECIESNDYRDTFFSIISMFSSILNAFVLGAFGFFHLTMKSSYLVLGIGIFLFGSAIFFDLFRVNKHTAHNL